MGHTTSRSGLIPRALSENRIMIWLLLLLLQVVPRELPTTQVGITPSARAELLELWTAWYTTPPAESMPAGCMLGHVDEGAAIEIVMACEDTRSCGHEKVLGAVVFGGRDSDDETMSERACSYLEHRPDWYLAVLMVGPANEDLYICARLAEGVQANEQDKIGGG